MRFVTETGSMYEVDLEGKRARRLVGVKDPTPRQGQDGEWKPFENCTPIEVGGPVFFIWWYEGPVGKSTMTSRVVSIEAAEA